MKDSSSIRPQATDITRRAVMGCAVAGGLCAMFPAASSAAMAPVATSSSAAFVPENDYPYFGYVPEDIAAR